MSAYYGNKVIWTRVKCRNFVNGHATKWKKSLGETNEWMSGN